MKPLKYIFSGVLILTAICCASSEPETSPLKEVVSHLPQASVLDGKYQNLKPFEMFGFSKSIGFLGRLLFESAKDKAPKDSVPLHLQTVDALAEVPVGELEITRLGHSSVLLRNSSSIWLVDPVFSKRASPVQFMGPARFHEVPLDYESFDEIEGILISHDHYDHLDEGSIRKLHPKVKYFAVPKGIGKILEDWGVESSKIKEFTWWQSMQLGSLTLTAAPAQHFSGRGMFGGMQTLWCGWSIKSDSNKIFYTGDTGYHKEFKIIGEELGPFDLALVETGAYDKDWPNVHMTPQESFQAFQDLQAKVLMPVHNGTFDLAFHAWYDPFDQIYSLALENKSTIALPVIGKPFTLKQLPETTFWWRGLNEKK